VTSKSTVFEALKLMSEKQIGAVMVTNNGSDELAGIMSERDYARKIILLGKASKNTKVADIMTPVDKMYKVDPATSVDECMVLITAKQVRHLPVFENDKLVGLISAGDVLRSKIDEDEAQIGHLSDYIAGKYI
jgi:CBS domain-containing protein